MHGELSTWPERIHVVQSDLVTLEVHPSSPPGLFARTDGSDRFGRERISGPVLFARRDRSAPRSGEQGRKEASPFAAYSEEAPLPSGRKTPGLGPCSKSPPADLHAKFRDGALEIGSRAIRDALDAVFLSPADVDYMLCVTSSGFMVPGLSSLFSRELGFDRKLVRADVVGMGCNAGLNGMNPLVQWVKNHPGRVALLVCCEINSAMYVVDETVRTGIVNSLFGDGAAAAVLTSYGRERHRTTAVRAGALRARFRELLHARAMGGHAVRLERQRREMELLRRPRNPLRDRLQCPRARGKAAGAQWPGFLRHQALGAAYRRRCGDRLRQAQHWPR